MIGIVRGLVALGYTLFILTPWPRPYILFALGLALAAMLLTRRWRWRGRPRWCHAGGDLATGLAALVGCWLLAWGQGKPLPYIHDEFAYLLAGDTFARGRWTNPPHPLWEHFEMFHVISQPTYSAKYPPGQGLWLAAGQVLTGEPIWGVWLSCGCAAVAASWYFRAVLPARWLNPTRLYVAAFLAWHWGTTYQGGAVAALGGALLFGGWERVRRRGASGAAAAAAVGLVLLAITRPYEGLVTCLLLCGQAVVWIVRPSACVSWQRRGACAAGAALILALAAVTLMQFHQAVTGHAWLMPYFVHQQQYEQAGLWFWQPERPPPPLRHAVFAQYNARLLEYQRRQRQEWGLAEHLYHKLATHHLLVYGNVLWMVPLAWGDRLLRDRRISLPLATLLLLLPALLLTLFSIPHYAAPALVCVVVVLVQGLRRLRVLGKSAGWVLMIGLVVFHLGLLLAEALAIQASRQRAGEPWYALRARWEQELRGSGRRHLLLVRYAPEHDLYQDWVANGAEIDGQAVIWARDSGEATWPRLRAYYPDRDFWLVEPDAQPPRRTPLP